MLSFSFRENTLKKCYGIQWRDITRSQNVWYFTTIFPLASLHFVYPLFYICYWYHIYLDRRDRMVVGLTTTYSISAYHNLGSNPAQARYTRYNIMWRKVCLWLATDRWFSPGTPVSSINKIDHHDIAEILLKVAFNTINQSNPVHYGNKWHSSSKVFERFAEHETIIRPAISITLQQFNYKVGKSEKKIIFQSYKTSFNLPRFIEVPVPSHDSERSCIYVVRISILTLFLRFFYYILELFWQCGIYVIFNLFNPNYFP